MLRLTARLFPLHVLTRRLLFLIALQLVLSREAAIALAAFVIFFDLNVTPGVPDDFFQCS